MSNPKDSCGKECEWSHCGSGFIMEVNSQDTEAEEAQFSTPGSTEPEAVGRL